MERMVEILKYLKDVHVCYMSTIIKDINITKEEIEKLCELKILYGHSKNDDSYYVSSKKRTNQMIEILLNSQKEITKQELNTTFGVSDYHIHKLLDEGKLVTIKRGVYQSNMVCVHVENMALPKNLTVTEEMMKAIDEDNLPEVLKILEETAGDEFIELSKKLWKWVMTQILGNKLFHKSEPQKQKLSEKITSDSTFVLEEKLQEIDLKIIEGTEEVQTETLAEEALSPQIETTESDDIEQELEVDDIGYTPTGLPLGELYTLYLKNRNTDPILAKEFLLEYKDQCEIRNIKFNYLDLKKIHRLIEEFSIPKEQLEKEQELKSEIKNLMDRELNHKELRDLNRILNQFYDIYQERGIMSDLYRGDYQAKVKNYSEALQIYSSMIQKEPWNITIYHRIASVFLKTGRVDQLIQVLETSLSYVPKDDFWRAQLAFCYVDKNKFSKVRDLVELENFNNLSQYKWCLRTVIIRLKHIIDQYSKYIKEDISLTYFKKIMKKIESVNLELDYYMELYSQLGNYHDLDEEMMTGNYFLKEYEDKVYDVTIDQETGNICPRRLEEYVKNFQTSIPMDEELLLYIAAAKIMFIHKWPKHGEHYLKLVTHAHSLNPAIQREYEQLIKNKKLYLNK